MNKINLSRLGIAVGLTSTFLYLGCILIMIVGGREGTVMFFNSLLHGMDTTSVVRMTVPLSETIIGIILTFIIGWFAGASIAWIYNFSLSRE